MTIQLRDAFNHQYSVTITDDGTIPLRDCYNNMIYGFGTAYPSTVPANAMTYLGDVLTYTSETLTYTA